MDINQNAATTFTETFFSQSLEKQIKECDSYTLSLLFESTFMVHQPVLEAGCGSGKWCAWFHEKNIKSDGIDWSAALMQRAQITWWNHSTWFNRTQY
jgi:2-polyprenyl-3-methyl-5-hydroxy-6-metoxy-1,4-benzoquinol methylase